MVLSRVPLEWMSRSRSWFVAALFRFLCCNPPTGTLVWGHEQRYIFGVCSITHADPTLSILNLHTTISHMLNVFSNYCLQSALFCGGVGGVGWCRRCRRQVGGVGATYDTAHTWSQGAEVSECQSERVSEGVGVSEKCRRSVRAECRSVGPGLKLQCVSMGSPMYKIMLGMS